MMQDWEDDKVQFTYTQAQTLETGALSTSFRLWLFERNTSGPDNVGEEPQNCWSQTSTTEQ